jgi:hypothetical protein
VDAPLGASTAVDHGIPGLSLIPDFISDADERALLDVVAPGPWDGLAKRRVQHYGSAFNYKVGIWGRLPHADEAPRPLASHVPYPRTLPVPRQSQLLRSCPALGGCCSR